jgi:hypothetical protein
MRKKPITPAKLNNIAHGYSNPTEDRITALFIKRIKLKFKHRMLFNRNHVPKVSFKDEPYTPSITLTHKERYLEVVNTHLNKTKVLLAIVSEEVRIRFVNNTYVEMETFGVYPSVHKLMVYKPYDSYRVMKERINKEAYKMFRHCHGVSITSCKKE